MGDLIPPLFNWAGSKRKLFDCIKERIPWGDISTFYEPFMGSGFVSLNIGCEFVMSDLNPLPVKVYERVKADNDYSFMRLVKRHLVEYNDKFAFNTLRDRYTEHTNQDLKLAQFVYFVKLGFGSFWRVKKDGTPSVQYGHKTFKMPELFEYNYRKLRDRLFEGRVLNRSYELIKPSEKDFVYLDPPYHSETEKHGYGKKSYTGLGFDASDQKKLKNFCRGLDVKGVRFLQSNSDTPFIRELYKDFTIEEVGIEDRLGVYNNTGERRTELLIRNYKIHSLLDL